MVSDIDRDPSLNYSDFNNRMRRRKKIAAWSTALGLPLVAGGAWAVSSIGKGGNTASRGGNNTPAAANTSPSHQSKTIEGRSIFDYPPAHELTFTNIQQLDADMNAALGKIESTMTAINSYDKKRVTGYFDVVNAVTDNEQFNSYVISRPNGNGNNTEELTVQDQTPGGDSAITTITQLSANVSHPEGSGDPLKSPSSGNIISVKEFRIPGEDLNGNRTYTDRWTLLINTDGIHVNASTKSYVLDVSGNSIQLQIGKGQPKAISGEEFVAAVNQALGAFEGFAKENGVDLNNPPTG